MRSGELGWLAYSTIRWLAFGWLCVLFVAILKQSSAIFLFGFVLSYMVLLTAPLVL